MTLEKKTAPMILNVFMKQADFPALSCKSTCLNYLHGNGSRKSWGNV